MQKFLEYWSQTKTGPNDDFGNQLYDDYKTAIANLERSRLKTHSLLIPVNTGKAWRPEFDPDMIVEVMALAREIEAEKAALKSISEAIEAFVKAVGGPSLAPLAEQLHVAKLHLNDAVRHANIVQMKAHNRNPRMAQSEIQDLPDVLAAEVAQAEAQERLGAQIADLTSRRERGRAILAAFAALE
jgi:hypothetical protein